MNYNIESILNDLNTNVFTNVDDLNVRLTKYQLETRLDGVEPNDQESFELLEKGRDYLRQKYNYETVCNSEGILELQIFDNNDEEIITIESYLDRGFYIVFKQG